MKKFLIETLIPPLVVLAVIASVGLILMCGAWIGKSVTEKEAVKHGAAYYITTEGGTEVFQWKP